jgi:hypothetical protein
MIHRNLVERGSIKFEQICQVESTKQGFGKKNAERKKKISREL